VGFPSSNHAADPGQRPARKQRAFASTGAGLCRSLCVGLFSLLVASGGPATAAEPEPAAEAVLASPTDEPPHHVKRHYLWSNERRHDLFFNDLAGVGGGYIGVGGDQNYTLAAAASAEVMWLIDLDAAVVNMHRLYAALLASAETPREFVARFEPRATAAVHAAVTERYPDAAERRAVLEVYHAYRDLLRDHLRQTAHARKGSTWLADPEKYQRLRDLAVKKRLLSRLCDLTGPRTMQEIAEAAKRAGVPVRVMYLSNAESWFHYGPEFRRNLTALPFDEKSVVLRTIKSQLLHYPSGDIWHYSLQKARHFAESLGRPAYRSIDVVMMDAALSRGDRPEASGRKKRQQTGLSYVGFPPAPGDKPLFVAKNSADKKALLAQGLVTRPEGNRESASEMDRDRKRRAAIELARANSR
jgi:hypothetical protein